MILITKLKKATSIILENSAIFKSTSLDKKIEYLFESNSNLFSKPEITAIITLIQITPH